MAKRTVTIKKIFINNSKKDGTPFKNPLVKIYFDTPEGEKNASSFVFKDSPAMGWKEGESVELDFVMNGEYMNFVLPKATDLLEARIVALEEKVFGKKEVKSVAPSNNPNATVEEMEQEKINVVEKNAEMADDLPW